MNGFAFECASIWLPINWKSVDIFFSTYLSPNCFACPNRVEVRLLIPAVEIGQTRLCTSPRRWRRAPAKEWASADHFPARVLHRIVFGPTA